MCDTFFMQMQPLAETCLLGADQILVSGSRLGSRNAILHTGGTAAQEWLEIHLLLWQSPHGWSYCHGLDMPSLHDPIKLFSWSHFSFQRDFESVRIY